MTKKILYRVVALLLLLIISACGEDGSSSSQGETSASVTLTADKTQVVADGTDGVTLTATVTDAAGAPLAHQVVSFAVPNAFLHPPTPVQFTDENGRLDLLLRPSLLVRHAIPLAITQADITATSLGATSSPVTISIVPKPTPATASVTLVADRIQAIADGRDTVTVTATVRDLNGIPIPGQPISFNALPGMHSYAFPILTDGNGTAACRMTVSPSASGADQVIDVTATSGVIISNTVTVTFSNPPQVPPALVTLTSDKAMLIADGTDHVVFTITATDSNGDPLAGQLYHLNVSSPYMWSTQIMTNLAGTATASLSYRAIQPSGVVPAVISVTATINGVISNQIDIAVSPP